IVDAVADALVGVVVEDQRVEAEEVGAEPERDRAAVPRWSRRAALTGAPAAATGGDDQQCRRQQDPKRSLAHGSPLPLVPCLRPGLGQLTPCQDDARASPSASCLVRDD